MTVSKAADDAASLSIDSLLRPLLDRLLPNLSKNSTGHVFVDFYHGNLGGTVCAHLCPACQLNASSISPQLTGSKALIQAHEAGFLARNSMSGRLQLREV